MNEVTAAGMDRPVLGAAPEASKFKVSTVVKKMLRSRSATFSIITLAIILIMTIGAPLLAPYNPEQGNLRARLIPPVWESGNFNHLLGTDALGRDMLSRIMYGGRISLLVGFITVVGAGLIGGTIGLLSGYFGGYFSMVTMRLADIQQAIPFTVLAIAVAAALGPGLRNTLIVLVITGWPMYARLMRADVLSIRTSEHITAATVIGCGQVRILLRHVLPGALSSFIVAASLSVARMILAEASLSFLGLGVLPPQPTWGGMIAEGRDYILTAWWISTLPGLALLFTILAINLFGDWIRDETDPRLRLR